MGFLAALRQARHGRLKFLAPIWLPLGRLYRLLVRRVPLLTVTQKIGPYGPFRLDSHFAFSDFEHWGGGHNNAFEATIEACRGKTCVLDIGAHIGLVSLPASQAVASAGRVFAFEPGDANLQFLRRHIALNGIKNVEVVPALAGARDGDVEFFERDGPTGQNSVVVKKNPELYRQTTRRQVTLDRFCAENALAPDIIKIDVEGAELMVLQGARHILDRYRPKIFLSVHPKELSLLGASVDALMAFIAEAGYLCCDIDGRQPEQIRLAEYLLVPRPA